MTEIVLAAITILGTGVSSYVGAVTALHKSFNRYNKDLAPQK